MVVMDKETRALVMRLMKRYQPSSQAQDVTERYLPMLRMLNRATLTANEWASLMNFMPSAVDEIARKLTEAGILRSGARGRETTWELTQAGRDLIR